MLGLGLGASGCGGDAKKPAKPTKIDSAGDSNSKSTGKAADPEPVKPKTARSRSGKTPIELVNLIGDSYKATDATMMADDLAKAEAERIKWFDELIEIGPGALGDVLDALNHPVRAVQEWACVALGALGQAEAAETLLKVALDDHDRNLGVHACDALGRIPGIAGALERLAPRLTTAPFQAGHPLSEAQAGCLRNAAAEAVTRGGSKAGVPVLIAGLDASSAEVRRDAAVRLRRLTGLEHPVAVDATPAARKAAVEKWEQWWEGAGALFTPKPDDGPMSHQVFVGEVGEKK